MLKQIDGRTICTTGSKSVAPTSRSICSHRRMGTGSGAFALFRVEEDAHGYLGLLRSIITGPERPLGWPSTVTEPGIFERSPKEPESMEQQLRGQT